MVERPRRDKRATWTRTAAETLTQITPITAALSRLYETTHPGSNAEDRERWENELTYAVNDLIDERCVALDRIDLDGSNYRHDRSANICSIVDSGTGRLRLGFVEPLVGAYLVDLEVDRGIATVVKKSSDGFSMQIREGDTQVDSGFVFMIRMVPT